MDSFSSISPEHRILIQSLIDGSIADADIPLINQQLREDSLLRAFYIEQSRMDSHLRDYHAKAMPLVLVGRENKKLNKAKVISVAVASIAVGMAAAIALMLTFKDPADMPGSHPSDSLQYSQFTSTPNPVPLARITGLENVRWAGATGDLEIGTWLSAGKLDLREGLVEITYDSGSSVIVKGPAVYYIEENNSGFLQEGEIKAHSPKSVAKFEIETPNTKLIDLGTTFGVAALANHSTAVHVIEGLVMALASGDTSSDWKELRAGDALEINDGIDTVAKYRAFKADPNQFDWAPPRRSTRSTPLNYLHWSFNGYTTGAYEETGTGIDGKNYPAKKADYSDYASNDPWQTKGQFGKALFLNGNNRFLKTSFEGISGNKPRTIACWIKLERAVQPNKNMGAITTWGKSSRGQLWKLVVRRHPLNKNDLFLRTEAGWGNTAGDTKLNDGQWHHVVSVFTGGTNADAGANVLHYVDGKLEGRSRTVSRLVDTKTDAQNHFPLLIGMAVEVPSPGNLPALINARKTMGRDLPTLEGAIDELYVFDDALTPSEIIQLMETNTPPE